MLEDTGTAQRQLEASSRDSLCGPSCSFPFGLSPRNPRAKAKAALEVAYPEIARRMRIDGSFVSSFGSPRPAVSVNPRYLGGNPVLASAAQDAVKQAKFEGSRILRHDF